MEREEAMRYVKTANEVVTGLGLMDLVLIALLLVGLLYGFRKGLVGIFGKFFQLVVTITFTLEYFNTITEWIVIHSPVWRYVFHVTVFVLLTLVTYFVSKFFIQLVGKLLNIQITDLIDKSLGALTGAVYCALYVSFISYFLLLLPSEWLHETFEKNNLSGPFLMDFAPLVHKTAHVVIPEPLRATRYELEIL